MSEQTPDYDEVTAEQTVQAADVEAAQRFDDAGDQPEAATAGPEATDEDVLAEDTDEVTTEPTITSTTDETSETEDDLPAADEAEDEAVDPLEEFKSVLRGKYGDWYVIHSYAGYENRVKHNL